MTIESLGRKGGPKPGDLGANPRHSRRPQPETRIVPTARPKPAPPRTPPGMSEARRAVPQPPAQRPQGQQPQGQRAQGMQPQGMQGAQEAQESQGQQAQGQAQGQQAQAHTSTQSRVSEAKPARPPEAQNTRDRTPGPNPGQQKPRGRGDAKAENRGERSLYDGGSPSANRLGPAKAMRARDVSRPRDW
ncbi:FtsZ-interacting cell division protein ZipA [Catenulispora sp. GP43]|uniref:hypothetical protein n=1 Tax=Catenulispora sp. GP43 TaxID=3156263 RepID=UPI003511DA21